MRGQRPLKRGSPFSLKKFWKFFEKRTNSPSAHTIQDWPWTGFVCRKERCVRTAKEVRTHHDAESKGKNCARDEDPRRRVTVHAQTRPLATAGKRSAHVSR